MKHAIEVVLVHGGWADASSWLQVIIRLQSRGITVSAAHLPLTNFQEDVGALNRHLNSRADRVLVVCHSYGGNVATQAVGTNQNVMGMAYIAALAPDLGKPFGSFLMEHPVSTNQSSPLTLMGCCGRPRRSSLKEWPRI
jgi:pimeloyl-ACP methyl ester carboxylesterase